MFTHAFRQHGIIYQSFWTLTGNPQLLGSREVKTVAQQRQCSTEQVLYRFVMQLGIVPLNGTTDPKHMADDLKVVGWEDLSAADMRDIGSVIGEEL